MVLTPSDSNSSSCISTIHTQIQDISALPQEAEHFCQFCSMHFLTLEGLGGHIQDAHSLELNLPPVTKDFPQSLNLEERVQALKGAIMRAQRHVRCTSMAMAPSDGSSSSSSYTVDDNNDDIITIPNFVGSDVTLGPHAYGFGNGDETSTVILPSSTSCNRVFGLCLNHMVRESCLMYPPPGFAPLTGESFIGVETQEGEDETNGEVQGNGGKERNDNEKPLHEELDLNLKRRTCDFFKCH